MRATHCVHVEYMLHEKDDENPILSWLLLIGGSMADKINDSFYSHKNKTQEKFEDKRKKFNTISEINISTVRKHFTKHTHARMQTISSAI